MEEKFIEADTLMSYVKDFLKNSGVQLSRAGQLELNHLELKFEKEDMKLSRKIHERFLQQETKKKNNAQLRKLFTIFAIVGFVLFTGVKAFIMYQVLQEGVKLNEFVIMGISDTSTIFTAILFTIKDYLFGGSMSDTTISSQEYES